MSAPPDIATFEVNGTRLLADEPYAFLDQLHAVNACLSHAIEERNLNEAILAAAARGVDTLAHLAAFGMAVMDHNLEARRMRGAS